MLLRSLFLFATFLLLFVSGCSASIVDIPPVITDLSEISLTDTPTDIPATLTPTFTSTPTATPTATSTPTSTPTPTRTRPPTATFTPTRYPQPTGHATKIDTKFHSAILNQDRRIVIYLPPGYATQTQRRYSVLYMLHGYGGWGQPITEWEQWGLLAQDEALTNAGQIQPMIIVQPDGFMDDGQASYFFNHSPGTDNKRWGDYVWQDVVNYVDANYRTIRNRNSRAIGGFSLGGQGALTLALLHPEIFRTVGAHSPSMRTADGSLPFFGDWNYYNQFDPIWQIQHYDNWKQLNIWVDIGANDDKWRNCSPGSDRCVEAIHSLLVARGVPHEWHDQWPGVHEGTYWSAHVPDYLKWYSSKLVGQQ